MSLLSSARDLDPDERPNAPVNLRAGHRRGDVLGTSEDRPRLSWQLADAAVDYVQHLYEIELSRTRDDAESVTTRHRTTSAEQINVPWPAEPLVSRERVDIRVRVAGGDQAWSPWSMPLHVEAGLLDSTDWQARLIEAVGEELYEGERRPPMFRKEFPLSGPITRARLYVTARGLAELEINGVRVGEDALFPGWSSYRHRLRYATYDVTAHLREGVNAIGAWTGDGWYRGRVGLDQGESDYFGDRIGLFAQLEVFTSAGESVVIATDETWSWSRGPILFSGIYDGEIYDARLLEEGWSRPDFSGDWQAVQTAELDLSTLSAHDGLFPHRADTLHPVSIDDRGDGRYIVDFGQNHAGRLQVHAQGVKGTTITFRHAEILQDGELCTRPLREARQTDVVTLGASPITWEPRFTTHGYRYVEVSGWPGELTSSDLVSRVIHSPLTRTGWFSSSLPDLNKLHENIGWTMRSNFVDIPTDCPQRNERLGWTGDLNLFSPTAMWLFDDAGMLSDWLRSLALEQKENNGWVPWYVPFAPGNWFWNMRTPGAVWGDVAVHLPWLLYMRRGDIAVLERQYDSAAAWVALVEDAAGPLRIWDRDRQIGDWLDPAAPPQSPGASTTNRNLIATVYFARSASIMAKMAAVLGKREDATRYRVLAEEIRNAIDRCYVLPDGRLGSDTQTAHALFLLEGLNDVHREAMAARFVELVESKGSLGTGIVGTAALCQALTQIGRVDLAYALVERRENPSWLYQVEMGATTVWERWDSLLPDGSVNPGEMTSFNHYTLGSVGDWMYATVAGLSADAPGYRRLRIAPRPGGSLTCAAARHLTPYGEASVSWERLGEDLLDLSFTVPVGATAVLDLPGTPEQSYPHGTHRLQVPLARTS